MSLTIASAKTRGGSEIRFGKFNVLVGPNNCGKSQTLRDIRDYVARGSTDRLIIFGEVTVELPSKDIATKSLSISPHVSPQQIQVRGVTFDLQSKEEANLPENWINQRFEDTKNPDNLAQLLVHLGRYWVAHLDAESRLRLASPTECYDTRTETPNNAMQAFFAGGDAPLSELRKAFKEAFRIDIALDWAAMKHWYLMVGSDFGNIPDDRGSLTKLLKDARPLAAQGDGYRSFAGVVLAMLTFADRLMLLDEPDAFLHPAQARVLGRWLGSQAVGLSTQIFLATHNADFLWGILSSHPEATVIRLNRTEKETQYHLVPPEATKSLVQSPLLSSQPVLDSLFQKGVVVCEGDPDRAIYQTVAHSQVKDVGGEDILFIHANGKDAMKNPIGMLRNAHTPVCAIADFDIINSEQVLRDILSALSDGHKMDEAVDLRRKVAETVEKAPEDELLRNLQSSVEQWGKEASSDLREARKRLMSLAQRASKWTQVKAKGIAYFEGDVRDAVQRLLGVCAEAGLFIVTKGELESWMALGASKGKEWNRKALEELHNGKCPPDLRQFIEEVVKYLSSKE